MAEEVRIDESDIRYFESLCDDLAKLTKKATVEVLEHQAALFTRDAMKLTPPYSANPISDSFNKHKQAGMKAVKHDVWMAFAPLADYQVTKGRDRVKRNKEGKKYKDNLKKRLRETSSSGKFVTTAKILKNVGINVGPIVEKASVDVFRGIKEQRPYATRLRQKGPKTRVVVRSSINQIVPQLLRELGKAKAGWMAAVKAFGWKGTVPQWITKHGASSGFAHKPDPNSDKPYALLANAVRYVQDRAGKFVNRVWNVRTHALRNQIETIEDYYRKKAQEKMRRRGVEVT